MTARAPSGGTTDSHPRSCTRCGAGVLVDERFCENCGAPLTGSGPSAPDPAANPARAEFVAGGAAAVSDRGLRRRRNEDAVAVAVAVRGVVVTLCDGVASTANAHHAADRASIAALRSLERAASASGVQASPRELLQAAFRSAQDAVCTVGDDDAAGKELSPSTTLVAAVTAPGSVAVGNVGDSRAYWLGPSAARLLTVDDSLAEELIAEGTGRDEAYADPEAHTITRWLGPDAPSVDPAVTVYDVAEHGHLVLCTDGLWNYFERPDQLAALLGVTEGSSSLVLAHRLVDAALAAGGHDNVTVAVVPVAPPDTTRSPSEE